MIPKVGVLVILYSWRGRYAIDISAARLYIALGRGKFDIDGMRSQGRVEFDILTILVLNIRDISIV